MSAALKNVDLRRRLAVVLSLLLLALVALPWRATDAARAQAPPAAFRYFPETGHNLGPLFAARYDDGGLPIFGLPLTEAFEQDGLLVQYFERARFELHLDLPPGRNVLLTRVGAALAEGRDHPSFAPVGEAPPGRRLVPETGHTLGGAFAVFWEANGGLATFGHPISEEHLVGDLLVQYFERARFELHPGDPPRVVLGHLGREYAALRGLEPSLTAPAAEVRPLAVGTARFASGGGAARNIDVAARAIDGQVVAPGATISFLEMVGDLTAARGYVRGPAIVGGVAAEELGGGVCNLTTAVYRAAFTAGLPIVERHPHSRLPVALADVPGLEAAIFTPDKDLRWRNDTPHPVYVAVWADQERGVVTVTLWGLGDGRRVAVTTPPPLARDAVAVSAAPIEAVVRRVVRDAGGAVVRDERIVTRYAPWAAPEPVDERGATAGS